MSTIKVVGIDIAKSVFQVCVWMADGSVAWKVIGSECEQAADVCKQTRMFASILAKSVSTTPARLSVNVSRNLRCLRAEAFMLASRYTYKSEN